MKRRSRNFRDSSQRQDYWPSFTDVMSTVAMLLFFLMLLAYIQNIMTGRRLSFFQAELEQTQRQLALINSELDASQLNLDESEKKLGSVGDSLEIARWELLRYEDEIAAKEDEIAEKEGEIAAKENSLKDLEAEIAKARAEIAAGQAQLTMSREEIEMQRDVIASSNQELQNLRGRLSGIAVMRLSILEKVKNSIENTLDEYSEADGESVSIGPNANIVINETLLFDYASSEVKEEARRLLDQLAIAFERLLDNDETRLYIDYINIEGHTDSMGGAGYNRSLSAERAVSVVNYMMESNPNLEAKYASYFGTGGFSKFRPLTADDSEESMAKNRRIEISVVVKDESIRNMIEEYLEETAQ